MDMGDDSDGGDGVDAELEAELNNLMFGGSKANKPRKTKGNFKDIQFRKTWKSSWVFSICFGTHNNS